MIIRFSVENYKSIYKRLDLSFVAESLKQLEDSNLIQTQYSKIKLLKALALYGANASGKTNLIKALDFMRDFVLTSAVQSHSKRVINLEPYKLLLKSQKEPTLFEIDFVVFENRYRYGFVIDKYKVHKEYLFSVLKTTEKLLFQRMESEIECGISFSEGHGKESFIKPTTLFLSTLAQLNATLSSNIIEWFTNLTIITDYNYPSFTGYTAKLIQEQKHRDFILKVFNAAGLDFEDVDIKTVNIDDNLMQFLSLDLRDLVKRNLPQQLQVFTRHKVYDLSGQEVDVVDFDLKEESAGTQKFFAIAGPIINSLLNGYPIVIDEMDARLHFKLVHFLVKLYCSNKYNPFGGQLVFSNHMLDLMDRKLLRRDQILLVSKTKTGSEISSIQKEGARSDTSFKKDYLGGDFGALPDVELNQLDLFDKYI
ncbi:MAG: ATP-binding protein [Reichenbachiella sp.]|uniref:AAA family ATPase n=1 Tax=Reichenbachiella sp. TaxID=2184521 RepID=UPI003298C0F6